MAAALRLSRRGLGRTWPNPAVGCLVVREGADRPEIVGRGWTKPGGRPHAEAVAMEEAGSAARGATLYVTLEPCAHAGKTPPCAGAIVEAGVGRVVSALEDPDPRVAGKGHALIRAAGIALTEGVLEEEARAANIGHVTRVTQGRPFVQLKLAHSRGGFISGPERRPVRITGEAARNWVHRMRAQADAILVGSGTIAADDPLLTCRLPGAEGRSPVRVVVDTSLSISPAAKVVSTARDIPTWVICTEDAAPERADALRGAGVEIIAVAAEPERLVPLEPALAALAQRGITRVLAEGGARIAASLVGAGLADEIVLIEGVRHIAAGGLLAFLEAGPELPRTLPGYELAEEFHLGEDLLRRYTSR
jgi:diaminohydroxyphosphoribosylaminopyrimidine deaminase/5-amino-6-(5-phosphoribosylamino)uracil reductase